MMALLRCLAATLLLLESSAIRAIDSSAAKSLRGNFRLASSLVAGEEYSPDSLATIVTPINNGFNFLSYPLAESRPIWRMDVPFQLKDLQGEDFVFQTGDQIKDQKNFTEYYEGYGWYGNMISFTPGRGFMLTLNAARPDISGHIGSIIFDISGRHPDASDEDSTEGLTKLFTAEEKEEAVASAVAAQAEETLHWKRKWQSTTKAPTSGPTAPSPAPTSTPTNPTPAPTPRPTLSTEHCFELRVCPGGPPNSCDPVRVGISAPFECWVTLNGDGPQTRGVIIASGEGPTRWSWPRDNKMKYATWSKWGGGNWNRLGSGGKLNTNLPLKCEVPHVKKTCDHCKSSTTCMYNVCDYHDIRWTTEGITNVADVCRSFDAVDYTEFKDGRCRTVEGGGASSDKYYDCSMSPPCAGNCNPPGGGVPCMARNGNAALVVERQCPGKFVPQPVSDGGTGFTSPSEAVQRGYT